MELVNYRFSLDMKKSGVQRVLQGFTTGDGMLRRLTINLKNNGETVNLDESYSASMYILPEGATESTINACTIVNDTIVYDVEKNDVANTGTTKMQLQIITSSGVTYCPQFALEVNANLFEDGDAYAAKFSELELALAQALYVYRHRIVSVDLADDGTFTVTYGDGTTYESETIKDFMARWEVRFTRYEKWMAQNVDGGLYDENFTLLASWDALVSGGYITLYNSYTISGHNITDTTFPDAYYLFIPDTITTVNNLRACNCYYIHMPETVTALTVGSFSGCTNLEEINIPVRVTKIPKQCFSGCTNLHLLNGGGDVTIFDEDSFTGTGVKSFPLDICASSGISLYQGAFYGCTSLKKVDLDNVTIIFNRRHHYIRGVFAHCTALTEIENFGTNNAIEVYGMGNFQNCTSLTSVTIGENVTFNSSSVINTNYIARRTFANCTSLVSATVPLAAVNDTFSFYTFEGCSALEEIAVKGIGTLYDEVNNTTITPTGLGGIAYAADNPPIVTFEMDENVTVDSVRGAFNGFTSLTSLTINWNATPTILFYAFANCTAIDDITVPSDVASVDDDSFLNVAHITYAGALDTSNWGALSYN